MDYCLLHQKNAFGPKKFNFHALTVDADPQNSLFSFLLSRSRFIQESEIPALEKVLALKWLLTLKQDVMIAIQISLTIQHYRIFKPFDLKKHTKKCKLDLSFHEDQLSILLTTRMAETGQGGQVSHQIWKVTIIL